MKYSIITINYNNCDGLRKTIESVISQSYKDYEFIIIDGGSTDGSRDVIEQHSRSIDYWVSEPDKGVYNAMNKGIRQAKGDYLNFKTKLYHLSCLKILVNLPFFTLENTGSPKQYEIIFSTLSLPLT